MDVTTEQNELQGPEMQFNSSFLHFRILVLENQRFFETFFIMLFLTIIIGVYGVRDAMSGKYFLSVISFIISFATFNTSCKTWKMYRRSSKQIKEFLKSTEKL